MALTKLNNRSGVDLSSYATSTDLNNLTTGKILQVQSAYTDTASSWNVSGYHTWTNIPSLSVTITPSSTSSKIMLLGSTQLSTGTDNHDVALRFSRGSSAIGVGQAYSGRTQAYVMMGDMDEHSNGYGWGVWDVQMHWIDSPNTTSATTYYISTSGGGAQGGTLYVNTQGVAAVTGENHTGVSTLIAMEIAG